MWVWVWVYACAHVCAYACSRVKVGGSAQCALYVKSYKVIPSVLDNLKVRIPFLFRVSQNTYARINGVYTVFLVGKYHTSYTVYGVKCKHIGLARTVCMQ